MSADERVAYPIFQEVSGGLLVPYKNDVEKGISTELNLGPKSFTLRDYQVDPVNKVCSGLDQNGGVFLKAACGTGKTIMSLAVCEIQRYAKVVVLVDQKRLADQWRERIAEFLPEASTMVFHSKATSLDELKDSKAQFNIVVAQSLMTKDWVDDPVKCDLLICDEAHVFSAPCFCKSIFNLNYANSLALTATDHRKDGLTWVFMKFLACSKVEVQGKTMVAKVMRPKVVVDTLQGDFMTAFCVEKKQMTWHAKCQSCELYNLFPHCGRLPRGKGRKGVKWSSKIMWTPLVKGLFEDMKYRELFLMVIRKMHKAGRNIIVFNQFTEPLEWLYEQLKEEMGDDLGIFTSKTRDAVEALECSVTLATYKIAQKGLDVPEKDTAVLMSPITEIEQVVGRVTRIKEGKKQPLIFDPIVTNVMPLYKQSFRRSTTYKQLGFELI